MNALAKIDLQSHERRRHSRVKVAIEGRYMLENRQEFPCMTIDMSPGGVLLRAPVKGRITEKVVAYLDHFGRIEGLIVRTVEDGFALKLALPAVKRDRVADLLTWLANRSAVGMMEDRRHQRIVPRKVDTKIELINGKSISARIIDISVSGAAVMVAVADRPAIGARVVVGRRTGKVVRLFEQGIAVEFLRLVPADTFDEDIVL